CESRCCALRRTATRRTDRGGGGASWRQCSRAELGFDAFQPEACVRPRRAHAGRRFAWTRHRERRVETRADAGARGSFPRNTERDASGRWCARLFSPAHRAGRERTLVRAALFRGTPSGTRGTPSSARSSRRGGARAATGSVRAIFGRAEQIMPKPHRLPGRTPSPRSDDQPRAGPALEVRRGSAMKSPLQPILLWLTTLQLRHPVRLLLVALLSLVPAGLLASPLELRTGFG